MSYCTLVDLKEYLKIPAGTTGDDVLLQRLLDAATSRINGATGNTFQASADTTHYFDPDLDIMGRELWIDASLSYLTSVVNGDSANITAAIYHNPRNATPWYALGIKSSYNYAWTYDDDSQDSIEVTGRFAWMDSIAITALARSTNVVTATCNPGNLFVGAVVYIVGCADTNFNGTYTLTEVNSTTVKWANTGTNDTDTTATLLTCPSDIVTACRRLAAWLYRQKDTAQSGTETPILTADGTVLMPSAMPKDVQDLLQPYTATL